MNKCGALILLACAFAVLTAERVEAAPASLRKKYAGIPIPQTWYAYLLTLPHLGITGSRY